MRNGTRPLKRQPRREFHRHFGGSFIIPSFSLDKGWHPDQNADNAQTECTGYTVAKILTDLTGIQRSPDFHYAAALYLEGSIPTTAGADFHAAMQSAVAVGSLPLSKAGISAKGSSEIFVANWDNWTQDERRVALQTLQNGTMNALGFADPYTSIISAAYNGQTGVSVGSPWYREWRPGADGIMSAPANAQDTTGLPWHNWVILGQTYIGVKWYAVAYPHQGENFGNKGLVYFDKETINAIMQVSGTGAIVFNPKAIRWISLVAIAVQRYPFLLAHLSELIKI